MDRVPARAWLACLLSLGPSLAMAGISAVKLVPATAESVVFLSLIHI